MDIRAYNKKAWDSEVDNGNPWTVPVSHEVIEAARRGEWSVLLTEQKSVPARVVSTDAKTRPARPRLRRRTASPRLCRDGR